MKTSRIVVLGLGLVAVLGCKANPQITALEQENRQLEDRLFQMRYELDTTLDKNESLQGQLDAAPNDPGYAPRSRSSFPRPTPADEAIPLVAPSITMPGDAAPLDQLPERFRSPTIDSPLVPPTPPPALPNSDPGTGPPPLFRSGSSATQPTETEMVHLSLDSSQVATVELDMDRIGGFELDGRSGDDGITLFLSPRTKTGRPVRAVSDVSVVLLDPTYSDDRARVARWDLSAEEVAGCYYVDAAGEGFRLDMAWPDAPPEHGHLRLFVRFMKTDGNVLETEGEVDIALHGDVPPDWTAAEPRPAPRRLLSAPAPARNTPTAAPSAPAEPTRMASRPQPRPRLPRAAAPNPDRPQWSPSR